MSANSNNNKDDDLHECRFVVTGFGPFGGVPSNPTSVIAESLIEYLQKHDKTQALASRTTTTVLEVSTVAVQEFLDGLMKRDNVDCKDTKTTTTVLMHLGVNYRGKGFQLEQCAYNDASFRIPDERGSQPDKELICKELPWKETLHTSLNVQDLCRKLHPLYPGSDTPIDVDVEEDKKSTTKDNETTTSPRKKPRLGENVDVIDSAKSTGDEKKDNNDDVGTNIRIFPSTDPGRFVCNYIYCYSLNKLCRPSMPPPTTQTEVTEEKDNKTEENAPSNDNHASTSSSNRKYACLFLHVPPVTVIPQEEQLKFVVELMKVIEQQLEGKKNE